MDNDFQKLLAICKEISEGFPDGVVYIGGIAVFLHVASDEAMRPLAEATHDADFYISYPDFGTLRDEAEIVQNSRLQKHQLNRGGFEFGIYTEHNSSLIVPYDTINFNSEQIAGVRVACLEHLLALKLGAYENRKTSKKGDKDARDIACIGLTAIERHVVRPDLCTPYFTVAHETLLRGIPTHPVITEMAGGNAKTAKELRTKLDLFVRIILGHEHNNDKMTPFFEPEKWAKVAEEKADARKDFMLISPIFSSSPDDENDDFFEPTS